MIDSEEYKAHIECTFAAFCKVVLHNAAINAYRDFGRKQKREVSLEYLISETSFEPFTTDTYFEQYDQPTVFVMKGQEVVVATVSRRTIQINRTKTRCFLFVLFLRLYRRSNRRSIWAKQEYSKLPEISGIKTATKRNGKIKT